MKKPVTLPEWPLDLLLVVWFGIFIGYFSKAVKTQEADQYATTTPKSQKPALKGGLTVTVTTGSLKSKDEEGTKP